MTSLDLQALLPSHLVRVDGGSLKPVPKEELEGKTVLLYFSAHW